MRSAFRCISILFGLFTMAPLQCLSADRPANDDFANRITLDGPSVQARADNTGATEEPAEYVSSGGRSLWWSWTAPITTNFQVLLAGSEINAELRMFTGEPQLSGLAQVVRILNFPESQTARLAATAGTTYYIWLASYGYNSPSGIVGFSIGRPPVVTVTSPTDGQKFIAPAPWQSSISLSAMAASPDRAIRRISYFYEPNSYTRIPIGASASPPFTYVWTNALFGNYLIRTVAEDEIGILGESSAVPMRVAADLPNDDFADRLPLSGSLARARAEINGATFELGEPLIGIEGDDTLWWKWIAPSAGLFEVSTTATSADVFVGNDLKTLSRIATTANANSFAPRVTTFFTQAAQEYAIRVTGPSSPGPIAVGVASAPQLLLEGTSENAVFNPSSAITFAAVPIASDRTVTRISFFVGRSPLIFAPLATRSQPPYTLTTNLPVGNYEWYAVAIDDFGLPSKSETRHFTVKSGIPNDDFDGRIQLQGTAFTFIPASIRAATLEPAEPQSFNSGSLWWTWTAPATATYGVNIDLRRVFAPGSPLYTFEVYTGATLSALAPVVRVALPNPYDGFYVTNFPATSGVTYHFRVLGSNDPVYQENGGEIKIARLPGITLLSPLQDSVFLPGGNVLAEASVESPDLNIAYVEFTASGETNLATRVFKPPYRAVWKNIPGGRSYRYTVQAKVVDEFGLSSASTLRQFWVPPNALNDNFASRAPLQGSWVEGSARSNGATLEPGEPSAPSTETIWWTWTAPDTREYEAFALSEMASRLEIFTGTSVTGLTLIAGITNNPPQSLNTHFLFQANAGTAYQIRMSPLVASSSTSGPLRFQIKTPDPIPTPTIRILTPINGQRFTPPSILKLQAVALADYDTLNGGYPERGSVAVVEFVANNTNISAIPIQIGPDTFSIYWTNRQPGSFTIRARATDQTGAFTESEPVTIEFALPPVVELRLLTATPLSTIRFSLSGPPGKSYTIQASKDLIEWNDIASGISNPDGIATVTEYNPPWGFPRFYRAVLEAP